MKNKNYIIISMIFLFSSEVYAMMRSMKSGAVSIAKGLDHSITSRSISMGQAIAIAVGVTILQDATYADISNATQGICFLGVATGVAGVPVYCAIHACKIKANIYNDEFNKQTQYWIGSKEACVKIISRWGGCDSPLEKSQCKKEFIMNQLGLYRLYAYNQEALSSQLMHPNALDSMPVILTTFGLLPSVLCGCSVEAVGTILSLSYCAGAAALLHARIEKKKWEQLDEMLIKNVLTPKLSDNINMNIPDNFMRAVDLKIAGMQRRATQIYEQADKDIEALRTKQYSYASKDQYYIHPVQQYDIQSKAHESVNSMIRKNINQVLELDEAALSRIDRENRMTQQFDVEFVRNEENTNRVMKRVEK